MGQYYLLANLTNGEYVHPHRVGDGAKLMELAYGTHGVMTALAVLIASGNGRGGGDLRTSDPLVGSWAGHRIVLAGDYDDPGLYCADFAAAAGASHDAFDPQPLYHFAPSVGTDLTPRLYRCFRSANEAFGAGAA